MGQGGVRDPVLEVFAKGQGGVHDPLGAVVVHAVAQGLIHVSVLQAQAEGQDEERDPCPQRPGGRARRTGCQSRRPLRAC